MSGQTDQSRPVSRVSVVEALTRIRALCDEHPGWIDLNPVRRILDAVSVDATPPQDDPLMPPETLRERLAADGRMFRLGIEAATPAQGIDRKRWEYQTTTGGRKQFDASAPPAGEGWEPDYSRGRPGEAWDRFDYHEEAYWKRLAVQPATPVEGVVLSPEDKALTIEALRDWHGGSDRFYYARLELAARLEASS